MSLRKRVVVIMEVKAGTPHREVARFVEQAINSWGWSFDRKDRLYGEKDARVESIRPLSKEGRERDSREDRAVERRDRAEDDTRPDAPDQ